MSITGYRGDLSTGKAVFLVFWFEGLGSFLGLEIGLHENGPPSFWCKPTANQVQTNRKPIRKSLSPKPFGPLAR
jgi:hypothetical protein